MSEQADKIRDEIHTLLQTCDKGVLELVQPALEDIVRQTQRALSDATQPHHRREERIETRLEATLVRMTNIRPGEKREFPAWIRNISHHGMCLETNRDFIPSDLLRVTFITPNGKVAERFIEICWLKRSGPEEEPIHTLGCRSVSSEESKRRLQRESKIVRLVHRVHKQRDISIQVVGPLTPGTERLLKTLDDMGFPVHHDIKLIQAINHLDTTGAEVMVFTDWLKTSLNAMDIDHLNTKCADLPKIALVHEQDGTATVLRSGVDECLSDSKDKRAILTALERAFVHRLSGAGADCRLIDKRAAIISSDGPFCNILHFHLENLDYHVRKLSTPIPQVLWECQMIFVECRDEKMETMLRILHKFPLKRIIACVGTAELGQHARRLGAGDYLCAPPKEEDVIRIMDHLPGAAEQAQEASESA